MNDHLSIFIPTLNEEVNLPQCLESVKRIGAKIFIIDSNSSDRTIEIAKAAGCEVVQGEWRTFSEKMNWAINKLPVTTPWTMRIDADEWMTDELIDEIRKKLPISGAEVGAYSVNRRIYFLKRWIRHGGIYPLWGVRVWRTGSAKFEIRELDEHMVVRGRICNFENDIVDETQRGLSHWIQKHNVYTDLEVSEIYRIRDDGDLSLSLVAQAARKRWLKTNLYYRLPKFLRPALFWMYRYIFRLGFLDGIPGLIYHTLHGFWFRFLIDAKLFESEVNDKNGN